MPSLPSAPRAFLVCTEGAAKGQRALVGEAGLMLGRGEHCDLIIEDTGVSREHARVLLHNDAVWVQDAGSRNGCFLNGRRLARHQTLSPGDDLRIGEHRFTLELEDPFPADSSISTFGMPRPEGVQERPAGPGRTPSATPPSATPPSANTPADTNRPAKAPRAPQPSRSARPAAGLVVLAIILGLGLLMWMMSGR